MDNKWIRIQEVMYNPIQHSGRDSNFSWLNQKLNVESFTWRIEILYKKKHFNLEGEKMILTIREIRHIFHDTLTTNWNLMRLKKTIEKRLFFFFIMTIILIKIGVLVFSASNKDSYDIQFFFSASPKIWKKYEITRKKNYWKHFLDQFKFV